MISKIYAFCNPLSGFWLILPGFSKKVYISPLLFPPISLTLVSVFSGRFIMKGLFSYDSPMMQILSYIGDLIILNFLYLLCCCPILTIGAAQAGLYTAMRVLNDKEDDSSVVAAFFRGFKNGFLKITLTWTLLTVAIALLAVVGVFAYSLQLPGWICIAPICIVALFQTLTPAFHSRFDCTPIQLVRNCWFLLAAHPLRSIGAVVLVWLPLVVFLLNAYLFLTATPIWFTLYFSTAILFGELFLRKPFKTLVEEFNRRQEEAAANDPNALPEPEKQTEKIFSDVPVE